MTDPIPIYEEGKVIELQPGIYQVKVLGSWFVKVGDFSLSLREVGTGNLIKWRRTKFGAFDYVFKLKARDIGTIDIPKWAKYSISFRNPENVIVTRMGPFGITLPLNRAIPNSEIRIVIG
jgi:hypothetical protein